VFKSVGLLSGDDWQQYVIRLLALRYGFALVEIPDSYSGDRGLEAYSLDGCAYQCYAPEQQLKIADLYEAQRRKVSDDIGKFINNREDLAKILKNVQISKWILVVPRLSSFKLNQHCKIQAQKVLDAQLPYVAKQFEVIVVSEAHFPVEVEQLLTPGIVQLKIDATVSAGPEDVTKWSSEHSGLVSVLDSKLKPLPALQAADQRELFVKDLLTLYLDGSNTLEHLKREYPYLYERVESAKAHRARTLRVDCVIGKATINDTRSDFGQELESQVKGLNSADADLLSYAAVAEWLMVCPLTPKA
jgi:hypothetical protein